MKTRRLQLSLSKLQLLETTFVPTLKEFCAKNFCSIVSMLMTKGGNETHAEELTIQQLFLRGYVIQINELKFLLVCLTNLPLKFQRHSLSVLKQTRLTSVIVLFAAVTVHLIVLDILIAQSMTIIDERPVTRIRHGAYQIIAAIFTWRPC